MMPMKNRLSLFLSAIIFIPVLNYSLSSFANPLLAKKFTNQADVLLIKGKIAEAIVLYQAAWEMLRDIETLRHLARAQTMAGQFDEAIENYKLVLKKKPPPEVIDQVENEIKRLQNMPASFSDQLFSRVHLTPEARMAFKKGVHIARKKNLKEAIRYLRAALILDPNLPGTYRILGAVYGKLKNPAKEQRFLQDYLRLNPIGRNADVVRKRLRKSGLLTEVSIEASFPCQLWVNGRQLNKLTPVKSLLLPPGHYTFSFVSEKYRIIRNIRTQLNKENAKVVFNFGVIEFKLKPWARVRANKRDLGLWDTIGLPVGKYLLDLEAHDGSRRKRINVNVEPGKIFTISSW